MKSVLMVLCGICVLQLHEPAQAASTLLVGMEIEANLPPYDPNRICVLDQRPGSDNPGPPPQRSSFPPGPGGDAMYRYAVAEWNQKVQRTLSEQAGCQ